MYLIDFYGSNLWNFYDKFSLKFFTFWNRMIKNVFHLPYKSHRYLIEPISEIPHLKTMIVDRFIKFYDSIINCNKLITRNLAFIQAKDCRSDFGRNINNICRENNTLLFSNVRKGDIKYFPISDNEKWRVSFLKELLHSNQLFIPLNDDEINFLIDFVACSWLIFHVVKLICLNFDMWAN